MTSKTAKSKSTKIRPERVAFVVFPGVKLLDLAGPLQAFNDAVSEDGRPLYRTEVVSIDGECTPTDTPVSLTTRSIKSPVSYTHLTLPTICSV